MTRKYIAKLIKGTTLKEYIIANLITAGTKTLI